eukprot:COSAG06_NODE_7772_length_2380_cov_1.957475_1_plen_80_part_00
MVVAGWLVVVVVVVVVVVADERGAECARATPPLHSILRAPEQQHGQHHFLVCSREHLESKKCLAPCLQPEHSEHPDERR